jgi:hypothetical protein
MKRELMGFGIDGHDAAVNEFFFNDAVASNYAEKFGTTLKSICSSTNR